MTTYAKLRADGTIEVAPLDLPLTGARRLSDNAWVCPIGGMRGGTVAEQESCGYLAIIEVAKPTITETQRADLSYAVQGGRPTQVWTVRTETAAESTARIEQANYATLQTEIATNINTLLASVTALNEITARTNATINANPATAIKDLTREVKTVARQAIRIARVVSNQLATTDSGV